MRHGYEDWEFWLRLGSRGRFGRYIPRPLFKYRKHGPTLYDVALSRHPEITAYIRSRHPELYEYEALAQIKKRWSPAVCLISSAPPAPQTIQDVQIEGTSGQKPIVERSTAPAFLLCKQAGVDPHSAEMAALAVWGGHKELQLPDGSEVLSRRAAEMWRGNDQAKPSRTKVAQSNVLAPLRGELRRHLVNAELLSWEAWLKNPLRSAGRLVPLRFKERINKATGRPVFDLSFYLQFQPGSLLAGNSVVEPLRYFPNSSDGRVRVALITPHLGPGGAENVLLDIAATLCRERFEVLLLATQSRDDRWSNRWRDHVEHVYDLAQLVPPERMSSAIFSIVSNWRCDAVLVQNSLYGYAALPHIKREFPGMKIMDLVHAFDDNWDQISVTAEVAPHIDVRLAVSSAVRDRLLATGIGPQRVLLTPNGVDVKRFHPVPSHHGARTCADSIRRQAGPGEKAASVGGNRSAVVGPPQRTRLSVRRCGRWSGSGFPFKDYPAIRSRRRISTPGACGRYGVTLSNLRCLRGSVQSRGHPTRCAGSAGVFDTGRRVERRGDPRGPRFELRCLSRYERGRIRRFRRGAQPSPERRRITPDTRRRWTPENGDRIRPARYAGILSQSFRKRSAGG